MENVIREVQNSLKNLETQILSYTNSENRPLNELYGFNLPPLSLLDMANLVKNRYSRLSYDDFGVIPKELENQLKLIPNKINSFINTTLPSIVNPNVQAIPIFFILIQWIDITIEPLINWQILNNPNALPKALIDRINKIHRELELFIPQKDDFFSLINQIKDVEKSVQIVPQELKNLNGSIEIVKNYSKISVQLYEKIKSYNTDINDSLNYIEQKKMESEKLVEKCEEAYKIATTKGLAGAFDQRANKLSSSIIYWTLGLLVTLIAGACIGANRFEVLNSAMIHNPKLEYIWQQIFLSILSLGAPIWFAWIATKQISQRFKLAEDYAFKATVAKAYEGYRKEAVKIDENLEMRLFSSALSRLEEPPLRLMEIENHGSPFQEIITSLMLNKKLGANSNSRNGSVTKVETGPPKEE